MTSERTALTGMGRRQRLILGGLLHNPGALNAARGAGLRAELIDDPALRQVYRLIERGPLPVQAAIRNTDVSPAAATARALHAEIGPLDPAHIMDLINDLVAEVEIPADDEDMDHEAPDPGPQDGSDERAGPIGAQRDKQEAWRAEPRRAPSDLVAEVEIPDDDDDDDELSGFVVADPAPPPYGRVEDAGPRRSKRRSKPEQRPKINPSSFPSGLDAKTFTEMKLRWLDEMNTDPFVSNMEFRAHFRMANNYMDPTGVITVGLYRLAQDIGATRQGVQKVLRKALACDRLLQVGESPRGGRGRTYAFIPMFSEPPELPTQLSVKRLPVAPAQTPQTKRAARPVGKGKKHNNQRVSPIS